MSSEPFRRTRRREVHRQMWVGSTHDLAKLLDTLGELQDDAKKRARTRYAMTVEPDERTKFMKSYDFTSEERRAVVWAEHRQGQIDALDRALNLDVEITMKRDEETLTGSRAEVLAHLEHPRAARRITVMLGRFVPSGYPPSENGFRITFDTTGVRASTYGLDDDWVTLTEARIKSALLRQRPTWWFLRGPLSGALIAVVASVIAILILTATRLVILTGDAPLNVGAVGAQVLITGVLYAVLGVASGRGIPLFELYEPGDVARGRMSVRGIYAVIGVVITAIVIPIILKALGIL